jgi:hypothetical protein
MRMFIILLAVILPAFVFALPTAKYTLKVVSETGEPIEGADVRVTFSKPKSNTWGSNPYGKKGLTDKDGIFVDEGETEQFGTYGAVKEGYYDTSHWYRGLKSISGVLGFRRWEPWNPTLEVVLKEIKNPIAMYADRVEWIKSPRLDDFVGYDLIMRDWIAPYGKGLTGDFLMKISSRVTAYDDYTMALELKFSNQLDGIQSFQVESERGSELRSDHEAPERSYVSVFHNNQDSVPGKPIKSQYEKEKNYYFRIRCQKDEDSCLFGKIYGGIELGDGIVHFKYYLNPNPGDRNVEFDPKRNLFKLKPANNVRMP